jgi:hypothetical protein
MTTPNDARRIVAGLPGAIDATQAERLVFEVGGKGFAWSYMARIAKKKPRVLQPDVLAIACSLERKEMLIEAAPEVYFDDDHYRGYPAVLTRLAAIEEAELTTMLQEALRMKETKRRPARNRD